MSINKVFDPRNVMNNRCVVRTRIRSRISLIVSITCFQFRRKAMKRVVTYFFGRVVVLSGFRVPVLLVSEDRVVGGDVP